MKTKICRKCKKEKKVDEFYKNKSKKDGLSYYCKKCEQAIQKEEHQRNKKRYSRRAKDKYKKKKEFIDAIKLGIGCQVCGYNKCIDALVFHHRNPEEKKFTLNRVISYSKENILKEIKKCQILCMNCHQELHNKLRNGGAR